jgi:hypothetical protein
MSPGPPCSVCAHPDVAEVDKAIVGGESLPKISARYREIGEDSLQRHKDNGHIAAKVQRAHEVKERTEADALLLHALLCRQRADDAYREALDPDGLDAARLNVALKALGMSAKQDALLMGMGWLPRLEAVEEHLENNERRKGRGHASI